MITLLYLTIPILTVVYIKLFGWVLENKREDERLIFNQKRLLK